MDVSKTSCRTCFGHGLGPTVGTKCPSCGGLGWEPASIENEYVVSVIYHSKRDIEVRASSADQARLKALLEIVSSDIPLIEPVVGTVIVRDRNTTHCRKAEENNV